MHKNLISGFIIISLFFISCSSEIEKNSQAEEDAAKEFLKEQGLDKRTTLFDIDFKDKVVKGFIESQQLKNDFFNYLEDKGLKLEDSLVVINDGTTAYIRNSVSNVRSNPGHSEELSTQYLMGQKVTVLHEASRGGWFYIQGPDRYLGWVDSGGIVQGEAINSDWLNSEKKVVQVNESVAYKSLGSEEIVTDLVFGDRPAQFNGEGTNYVLPDGRKVYINEKDFTEPELTDPVALVLDKAYSLMGRPYLWGGTSTKGMDCSGFTRTSFMNASYLLGRDASLQVKEGTEVDKNDISQWKPGDLLFFGSLREDGSERITHVGIHVENGRMIHEAGRVHIASLNPDHDDYNQNRAEDLMRVKRIFQ